jgi:hypothetical protein
VAASLGVEVTATGMESARHPLPASHRLRPQLAALRSEPSALQPVWSYTPFAERWLAASGLREEVRVDATTDESATEDIVYLAVSQPVGGAGAAEGAGGAEWAEGAGGAASGETVTFFIDLCVPRNEVPVTRGWIGSGAVATDPSEPWEAFFDDFPRLTASDPYLGRYVDYRLFGLRLNRVEPGIGNIRYPAVAEGIGYFHVPITYSAQCHMWETRWCRNPAMARGSLLNFLACQKDDGSLHGRLYTNHLEGTDFYHANWGDAALAVDAVHPDPGFLTEVYAGLSRYARWLDRTRDREQSGLYDILNHYETGQEYMSRYQAVDPDADRYGWEDRIRLKGIDVTVYAYQLKRALCAMAYRLDHLRQARGWGEGADRIGAAILERMWDEEIGLFSDVEPTAMARTGVKAAVSFYPLLTDLVSPDRLSRLLDHLTNPEEFATPYPVPSSSRDDPMFDASAEWKGKRHICPWNGRVWPMTNCHIVEGLLRQWHRGRREVGPYAAHLLSSFIRMMFHQGNPELPNSYEHYNPITGRPSVYRGIDDYQHSWILDLIVRGAAGLEPCNDEMLLVDPLPLELDELQLTRATVRGRSVSIERRGSAIEAMVAGTRHDTEVGDPLEIAL